MSQHPPQDARAQKIEALKKENAELKQANAELWQSNEAYRQLVENLNEVLYVLDPDGIIRFITPNVEQIGGYRPEELLGRPFTDFVHPQDLQERFRYFQRIFNGEDLVTEYRYLTQTGRTVWTRTHARAKIQDGKVTGIQGILMDISDRKRFEEALRQSEKKFRDIFDSSGDAILVHDSSWRYVEVNETACRYLGYTRDELLGRNLKDIISPRQTHRIPKLMEKMEQTGRGFFEALACRKDGSEIPVEISSRKIEFEGKPCYVSLSRDISHRLKKEKEYAQILNTSIDGFWVVDSEGRILEANPAAACMLGYTVDEMLDLSIDDINAEDPPPEIQKRIQHVRDKGSARYETRHRKKDGTVFDVEISTSYLPYTDGHLIVFIRDITERKTVEERNVQLQAQVLQSQKLESVGRLAGGIAHDLNNLLSPVLGYGELLLRYIGGNATCKRQLDSIIEAAERARALVRQLLAFSRQQMLEFKTFDLNDLLSDFESLIRRTLREDIALHIPMAPSLPPIKGDSGQVEQVLMNLVVNAQDAMPDGGDLTIKTAETELDESYARLKEGVRPGRYVMLEVSDTGHGMDAGTMENLFEPFFTTKEKEMGTGLGLSTAYGIVKQHGGNIWAYSEAGLGACFRVYLPAAEHCATKEDAGEPKAPAAASNNGETVLLAEDEAVVRDLVASMLDMQGYTVIPAENGRHAIDAFNNQKSSIDLLLTDVIMPDMNGKALYKSISEACPDLKVIYMSGYTENVIAYHGVLDPDVNFIQKPFSMDDLNAKIQKVLQQ